MSDRSEDELADVAEELAEELRALRQDLDRERRRRTPLGLPRPPRPREVLRLADEFAIPAVIAILEANIKLLEALQGVIRLADTEREARRRGREATTSATSTAADAGRATMRRLQDALEDLGTALESGALPDDRAGDDVLADVRELQSEIEQRLDEARETRDQARETRAAVEDADDGSEDPTAEADDELDDGVEIDIDAELDSLKDRYGEGPGEDPGRDAPGEDDG